MPLHLVPKWSHTGHINNVFQRALSSMKACSQAPLLAMTSNFHPLHPLCASDQSDPQNTHLRFQTLVRHARSVSLVGRAADTEKGMPKSPSVPVPSSRALHATQPSLSHYFRRNPSGLPDSGHTSQASPVVSPRPASPFCRVKLPVHRQQSSPGGHPVSAFGRSASEADTMSQSQQAPSVIIHDDDSLPSSGNSRGRQGSNRAGPTSEGTQRRQVSIGRSSADSRSPFEADALIGTSSGVSLPNRLNSRADGGLYMGALHPTGASVLDPADTAPSDLSLAGPASTSRTYLPNEPSDQGPTDIPSAASGGKSMMRVGISNHQKHRPPHLVIEHRNDEVSTVASEQLSTMRGHDVSYMHTQRPEAIAAVANDIYVIDAEDGGIMDRSVPHMGGEPTDTHGLSTQGASHITMPTPMPEHASIVEPVRPVKWWVPRCRQAESGNDIRISNPLLTERSAGEHHKHFWFDSDSVLSRKPSVRFIQTADLLSPRDNGQLTKKAIAISRYCVLVMDVPVEEALHRLRAQKHKARQSKHRQQLASCNASERCTLTRSNVSLHAETHHSADHEHHSHFWNWITAPLTMISGFGHHHGNSSSVREAEYPKAPLHVDSRQLDTLASMAGDETPLAPSYRRSTRPVAESLTGEYWEGASDCETLLPPDTTGLRQRNIGKPSASRVTDLRSSVREDGLNEIPSACDAPGVIEGVEALRLWRDIMSRASLPKCLEEDLCRWVDEKEAADRWERSVMSGSPPCCRSAGAVAESKHESRDERLSSGLNLSDHRTSSQEPDAVRLKMEVYEDADIDHGAQQLGANVAELAAHKTEGDDQLVDFGEVDEEEDVNPIRQDVSQRVAKAFDSIFTEANPRLIPILNHQKVHMQLIKWDQLHQKLELIEAKEKMMKDSGNHKPVRHRVGLWGLCGKLVSTREHLEKQIAATEDAIDRERREVFSDGIARAYFVIFETQRAATVAAQALLHCRDARKFKTKQAPGPDNVNWSALWCSSDERLARRILAGLAFCLVMGIPLGAFAGMMTELSDVICPRDPLGTRDESDTQCLGGDFLRRMITQVLPTVLVILWQNGVMPLTIYTIALFEKAHVALSSLDRRILMLFFWWDLFNLFFGSVLAGSITREVRNLINEPGNIGRSLGTSLPNSSNFFINYLTLRAFGLVPFRLVLVHGGIWRWLFKCGGSCGCVLTARDTAAFIAPASIRYGRELGVMMLVFITGWAYAVVSPLVVVVSAIYFMSSWIVWRWQVAYVYVRCYEGGGSMWRSIVACMMICMYTFVFFTGCVFVAKQAFYQAAFLSIPMFVVITAFWRYLRARYDPALKYVPLEVSVTGRRVKINDLSYIAAPLRPKCSGWHPEWGKAWESWGAPNYTS